MLSDLFDDGHTKVRGYVAARSKTANFTVSVPKNAIVDKIYIRNNTANAVTGGVKVGTTDGGTDVVTAAAVAASAIVQALPTVGAINTAAARTLYIQAVTAWNSANVDVRVDYTCVEAPGL